MAKALHTFMYNCDWFHICKDLMGGEINHISYHIILHPLLSPVTIPSRQWASWERSFIPLPKKLRISNQQDFYAIWWSAAADSWPWKPPFEGTAQIFIINANCCYNYQYISYVAPAEENTFQLIPSLTLTMITTLVKISTCFLTKYGDSILISRWCSLISGLG
jgi:hypothetical protein